MRNVFIGAAAIGVVMVIYAARRMGSGMGGRAMQHCEVMFEHMPDDFPPKRMMRGIDEIREQNTRILHQIEKLEQNQRAATAVAAE